VKIFNWLFTMYRGRVHFTAPVLWTIGFMVTFSIGGMTGVMMAIPGADFVLHNSLFLVAHFHNAIIGGVVFGYLAGVHYWFPKVFGIKPSEKLGKASFWCWFTGFYVAFVPLYVLGFMGMTRRTNHYDNPEWQPWLIVAAIGAAIIALGVVFQVLQWVMAFVNRNKAEWQDVTGDPWDARTLEWSTSSPPPVYNFAVIPQVGDIDAFAHMKESGQGLGLADKYSDIHMPSNTSAGFFVGVFSLVLGFAGVWHITWLGVLAFVAIVLTIAIRSFGDNDGYYIPAATVREIEERRHGVVAPVTRREMVAEEA
jgi:cytochrome o ubiquinol oxidase subunit I